MVRKKGYLIGIAFLLILGIPVISYFLLQGRNDQTRKLWKRCLNETANPCKEFYEFTCGNYKPNVDVKKYDNLRKALIDEYQSTNKKCFDEVLNSNETSESSAVQKMRIFRDTWWAEKDNKKSLSIEQLIDNIKSFVSCPVLDSNWSPESFDLTSSLKELTRLTGRMYLFKASLHRSSDTSIRFVVSADNSTNIHYGQFFSPNGMANIKTRRVMEKIISGQLQLVTSKVEEIFDFSEDVVEKIVQLSMHVYKTIKHGKLEDWKDDVDKFGSVIDSTNPVYETIKFDELDDLLPIVGKDYFLNNELILKEVKTYLSKNPPIFVVKRSLLADLNSYYAETDKELLANYLCVLYIDSQMPYLNASLADFVDPDVIKQFESFETSDQTETNNSTVLQNHFGFVTDHLFVKKCVDPTAIENVQKIADEVKLAVQQIFAENKWIENRTRADLISKVKYMKSYIGAPDTAINSYHLDNYYKQLNFETNDTLREMERKLAIFVGQRSLRFLVDQEKYIETQIGRASEMTVQNFPNYNAFAIQAGYLIPPNYYPDMPKPIQFAAIGSVIGSQIFHGFNGAGLHFDEKGVRSKSFGQIRDWSFNSNAICLDTQYSQIKDSLTHQHLNGTRTLNENIANNEGVRAAYKAYRNSIKEDDVQQVSGFYRYDNNQTFFIGFGLQFCAKNSYDLKSYIIDYENYVPDEYRVNVLTNMPEFAKAFKCPRGTKMNTENKCQIW